MGFGKSKLLCVLVSTVSKGFVVQFALKQQQQLSFFLSFSNAERVEVSRHRQLEAFQLDPGSGFQGSCFQVSSVIPVRCKNPED